MDRLPPEILQLIISYLTIEAKKEFSLVCHRWYNSAINHSMYTHIVIRNKLLEDAMVDYFTKNKQRCQQVRSVYVQCGNSSPSFYLALPHQFPRLQVYVLKDDIQHFGNYKVAKLAEDIDLQPWNKITTFDESVREAKLTMYHAVLKRGAFVNLTTLQLEFSRFGVDLASELLQHLQLAPKLKHLALGYPELTLREMEVLHERAPLLETLYLSNLLFDREDSDLSFDLEDLEANQVGLDNVRCTPAPDCLERVSLLNMERMIDGTDNPRELHRLWMEYLGKKYIHVKHLAIDNMKIPLEKDPIYKQALVKLVSLLPLLEMYNVNIVPVDHEILRSMDDCPMKLENMAILDNSNEIKKHMVDLLSSKQADTLQSLSIRSATFLKDDGCFEIWEKLRDFTALRHLELDNYNKYPFRTHLNLTHIIQAIPQLESIKVIFFVIDQVCNTSLRLAYNATNWKSIQLKSMLLCKETEFDDADHIDLMTCIAHNCPALEILTLDGEYSNSFRNGFRMEFPHRYFKRLEVSFENMRFFKVYNENQAVWYEFDGWVFVKSHFKKPILGDQDYVSIVYQGSTCLKIMGKDMPNW